MGASVSLEVEGRVATVRIDRPPANAIAREVSEGLLAVVREAGERDDVGAVVLWGGPRIFSAGADLREMAGRGPEEVRPQVAALGEACAALEELPKVTIAAINGYALGGGCELALACDLRVAARDAELGQPEIRLGIIPGAGGTQRLPRLVGLGRARELIYTGRRVGADEALAMGLVDRVVAPGEVLAAAVAEARRYASGPTRALAAAKAALRASLRGDPDEGLRFEREAFCELFATRDADEGIRAFLEKREPRFEGR
ncbi:MAG TPA: enoyl-CoA hydratase/isomerase family protein [Actinomycetota bacterium]|nr:enoyl-CoA hydratase/isomerase family protein [Actinomycetota bacterium]